MLSYDEPIIEQVVVNVNDPAVTSSWCRIKKDLHGTQPTDVQQLQAKIAALTIRLETYVRDACLEDKEVFDIAAKMRQLSAMQ
jgi:hypothetical protein